MFSLPSVSVVSSPVQISSSLFILPLISISEDSVLYYTRARISSGGRGKRQAVQGKTFFILIFLAESLFMTSNQKKKQQDYFNIKWQVVTKATSTLIWIKKKTHPFL